MSPSCRRQVVPVHMVVTSTDCHSAFRGASCHKQMAHIRVQICDRMRGPSGNRQVVRMHVGGPSPVRRTAPQGASCHRQGPPTGDRGARRAPLITKQGTHSREPRGPAGHVSPADGVERSPVTKTCTVQERKPRPATMHDVSPTALPAQSTAQAAGLPRTGRGGHNPGTPYMLDTVNALTNELTLTWIQTAHIRGTTREMTPLTLRG